MTRLTRTVLPALALLVVLAKVMVGPAQRLSNSDTFFHLRFGNEFLDRWRPWSPGQLSPASSADWTPTQWLAQVGMALVERIAGQPGLSVLFATVLLAVALTWYLAARQAADPLVAAVVTATAFVATGPALSLRPQVASYLLMTITVLVWNRAVHIERVPWLLVPLIWLWAMTHGMWIVGVGFSTLLAVGAGLDRSLPRRVLMLPVAMLLAGAVTPAGPRLLRVVFEVNSRAKYFSEWGAPDLFASDGLAALGILGVCVLPFLLKKVPTAYDLALIAGGMALVVYSARTVPLAVAALLPFAACHLQSAIGTSEGIKRAEKLALAAAAGFAVLVVAAIASSRPDAPPAAVRPFEARLDHLPAGSPVLTDSEMGGFLLWTHPDLEVPVHGYGDVYTDDELENIFQLFHLAPRWERTLERLGADVALLGDAEPLTAALKDQGWLVVEQGAGRTMLMAPADAR